MQAEWIALIIFCAASDIQCLSSSLICLFGTYTTAGTGRTRDLRSCETRQVEKNLNTDVPDRAGRSRYVFLLLVSPTVNGVAGCYGEAHVHSWSRSSLFTLQQHVSDGHRDLLTSPSSCTPVAPQEYQRASWSPTATSSPASRGWPSGYPTCGKLAL